MVNTVPGSDSDIGEEAKPGSASHLCVVACGSEQAEVSEAAATVIANQLKQMFCVGCAQF
jgi:hypothetical protein